MDMKDFKKSKGVHVGPFTCSDFDVIPYLLADGWEPYATGAHQLGSIVSYCFRHKVNS